MSRLSIICGVLMMCKYILLTKMTAVQNEVALSYHTVRGLCILVVIFAATKVYFSRLICHVMKHCILNSRQSTRLQRVVNLYSLHLDSV